jgi:enoyl-CoA hydratase/carnithine racemase
MEQLIVLERPADNIVVLTLNRPDKKNALSIALRDAVSDALDTLRQDTSLKCVILTGAGTAFSAGFDLSEFQASFGDRDFHAQLWASSDRYHRALLGFPLPLVAAVNGPALGGGSALRYPGDGGHRPLRTSGSGLRRRRLCAAARPDRRRGGTRVVPHRPRRR